MGTTVHVPPTTVLHDPSGVFGRAHYAPLVHMHQISDVSGLTEAISNSTVHAINDISGSAVVLEGGSNMVVTTDTSSKRIRFDVSGVVSSFDDLTDNPFVQSSSNVAISKPVDASSVRIDQRLSLGTHLHIPTTMVLDDVSGVLGRAHYAPLVHQHAIADVTGLTAALASNVHAVNDISGSALSIAGGSSITVTTNTTTNTITLDVSSVSLVAPVGISELYVLGGTKPSGEITSFLDARVVLDNGVPTTYAWSLLDVSGDILYPDANGAIDSAQYTSIQTGSNLERVHIPLTDASGALRDAGRLRLSMTDNPAFNQHVLLGNYIPHCRRFYERYKEQYDLHMVRDTYVHDISFTEVSDAQAIDGNTCMMTTLLEADAVKFSGLFSHSSDLYMKPLTGVGADASAPQRRYHYYKYYGSSQTYQRYTGNLLYPSMRFPYWHNTTSSSTVNEGVYYGTIDAAAVIANYPEWLRELYRRTYRYIVYSDPNGDTATDPTVDWSTSTILSASNLDITYQTIAAGAVYKRATNGASHVQIRFQPSLFASL